MQCQRIYPFSWLLLLSGCRVYSLAVRSHYAVKVLSEVSNLATSYFSEVLSLPEGLDVAFAGSAMVNIESDITLREVSFLYFLKLSSAPLHLPWLTHRLELLLSMMIPFTLHSSRSVAFLRPIHSHTSLSINTTEQKCTCDLHCFLHSVTLALTLSSGEKWSINIRLSESYTWQHEEILPILQPSEVVIFLILALLVRLLSC